MTYRGHCAVLVGLCYLRQKNIRTKGYIEKPDVCSIKFDIRLSFQCIAPAVAQATVPFVEKNRKVIFCSWLLRCHSWLGPGI